MSRKALLESFKPAADAVALLLSPQAEVVIHDIDADTIVYIANPFSQRAVGDPSLIDVNPGDVNEVDGVIGPYEKAGNRGQRIRSITAVLRDLDKKPVGLMCINLDFSILESALDVIERFVRPPDDKARPEALFRQDWRETIKLETRSFLVETGLALESLTQGQRLSLIKRLYEKGLFCTKKSVEQVAGMVGVSRTTIYKDLATVKKNRRPLG